MNPITTIKQALDHKNISEMRVTYHDTDKMGHAYYSRYLVWFEIGRTEWCRDLNMDYRSMEDEGIYMPVRECNIVYHAPIGYDDLIEIHTSVEKISGVSMKFIYKIHEKENGTLIAEGFSVQVFVNADRKVLRAGHQIFIK